MSAIRLARGATGRSKLIKFAGCYHGHADALLVGAGSGVATFGLPDSPGVTTGAVADTLVLPWNDVAAVEKAFAQHGGELAVLACEPVPANMGVVPAEAGFLELLRELTTAHGALLLFDEVMTGFRVARGGASEHYGITADLVVMGKVVGGGFPLAAFGGPAAIMTQLAPVGPVYQAGTLSGNPVAVAAGLAQLRLLDDAAYARLAVLGDRLIDGLTGAIAAAGVAARIQRVSSLFSIFFSDEAVRDFAGAKAADHARYARFFNGMLARGHYLPPSGYEAIFVSLAHTRRTSTPRSRPRARSRRSWLRRNRTRVPGVTVTGWWTGDRPCARCWWALGSPLRSSPACCWPTPWPTTPEGTRPTAPRPWTSPRSATPLRWARAG